MNGAESLIRALYDAGVTVCFTNPGTTEIHLLEAIEKVPEMLTVLGLFEGVCSGAADGYARMTGKPAATLLHLGPGLGNALANLHNARRARSPVINLVGDHPAYHRKNDPPLTSDIAAMAASVSGWVRETSNAAELPEDGIAAVNAAIGPPGQVSTLIIPADCAWNESRAFNASVDLPRPAPVSGDSVSAAVESFASGKPAVLLLGGKALVEPGLTAAARIARKTGAVLMAHTFDARFARGAGLPVVRRLPYFHERAKKRMSRYSQVILAGTVAPTPFFAYPGESLDLLPEGCEVKTLAAPHEDVTEGLLALEEALGAGKEDFEAQEAQRPRLPGGALNDETAGAALGALLPENAIVSDESGTSGAFAYRFTAGAPPHDWLCLTGGSIGQGIPVATGAALACPGRKVVCLQGDGGGMYTLQALWTQARENLDVTTIIFSNRSYRIIHVEFERLGYKNPGPKILDTVDLSRPDLDWVQMAKGMGVSAARAGDAESFSRHLAKAFAETGPHLIEAVI